MDGGREERREEEERKKRGRREWLAYTSWAKAGSATTFCRFSGHVWRKNCVPLLSLSPSLFPLLNSFAFPLLVCLAFLLRARD